MTLLILTQMLKGSKRWQKHQKKKKIVKIKGLDFKSLKFLKILVLIQCKGCEMIKKRHHHWTIGGDAIVNSKGINKKVIDT